MVVAIQIDIARCGRDMGAKASANEPRIERVYVPWIGPSMNTIWAGVSWHKRKQIADAGHKACWPLKLIKPFSNPVKLAFQPVVKGRRYDCCNYALTNKVIVDGMVRCGLLKDDTNKYVLGVETLVPEKGNQSGVWITITEILSND